MSPDLVTELHALAVLDVLEAAQELVDERWRHWRFVETRIDKLEDALTRLDRLEVVQAAAA